MRVDLAQAAQAGKKFLFTEAETGLTFARIALDTQSPEKAERNRQNARKAYEAILRHFKNVVLEPAEIETLENKLQELRDLLRRAGESI